jgi:hypothetical protein
VNTFATITMVLGLLFIVGVVRALHTQRFVRRAVRVRAQVIAAIDAAIHNPETSSQSASVSRYVVEISDHGTRTRRVTLSDALGGAVADKLVADDGTIAVMFDPTKPDVVRIDSPWALYFFPGFLCAPAVLWLLLIVYVWLRT